MVSSAKKRISLYVLVAAACGMFPFKLLSAENIWKHFQDSMIVAARSPGTWVPLAAAGVIYILDADRSISYWASSNTPLFGSQENAQRYSDYFSGAASVAGYGTALAVPWSGPGSPGALHGLTFVAAGVLANELNYSSTAFLKSRAGRERPDASDRSSFPSGHNSHAAVNVALASSNLRSLRLPEEGKTVLRLTFVFFVAGTSWARIEAKKHYPTDVLAGVALGHFIGSSVSNLISTPGQGTLRYALFVDPFTKTYRIDVRTPFN